MSGTIHLRAYAAAGAELPGGAVFAGDAAKKLRLAFDMDESRALSRLVTRWKQAAPR